LSAGECWRVEGTLVEIAVPVVVELELVVVCRDPFEKQAVGEVVAEENQVLVAEKGVELQVNCSHLKVGAGSD